VDAVSLSQPLVRPNPARLVLSVSPALNRAIMWLWRGPDYCSNRRCSISPASVPEEHGFARSLCEAVASFSRIRDSLVSFPEVPSCLMTALGDDTSGMAPMSALAWAKRRQNGALDSSVVRWAVIFATLARSCSCPGSSSGIMQPNSEKGGIPASVLRIFKYAVPDTN